MGTARMPIPIRNTYMCIVWHLMQSIHFHVFIQSIVLNANVKNAAYRVCIGFAGNVCAMCLCIVIVAMFTITMYNFR